MSMNRIIHTNYYNKIFKHNALCQINDQTRRMHKTIAKVNKRRMENRVEKSNTKAQEDF